MSGSRPVQTPAGLINVEAVNAPSKRGSRAQVRISGFDTWSVMRTAFVLSLAIAVVIVVAVFTLWALFEVTGVWDSIGRATDGVFDSSANVRVWFGFPRVAGITLVIAFVEVVLTTAALTLLASLYNVAGSWVGGLEVTLTEER